MKQKGNAVVIIIFVLIFAVLIFYFWNKSFSLIGNYGRSSTASPTPTPDQIVITEPQANTKLVSPLKIRGTVPPGWMFEGTFPIKLLDSNRKLIVQSAAKEEVPGAWQSNVSVYFTATLSFTTVAKSGFIILENDNPSGDPSKAKTFEVPVTF